MMRATVPCLIKHARQQTVRCTPRVEKLDIGLDFMELRQILTVFIRATLFYSAVFSFDHVSVRPVGLSVCHKSEFCQNN